MLGWPLAYLPALPRRPGALPEPWISIDITRVYPFGPAIPPPHVPRRIAGLNATLGNECTAPQILVAEDFSHRGIEPLYWPRPVIGGL